MKNYIKRATVILSLVMAMSVPVNVHAEEYSGEPTEEGVYIAITGETEDFYSNEDIYNASISMYDSEALALYNQYLEQAPASISEGEDFAVAALEGFTQYAVEEGIIEDTACCYYKGSSQGRVQISCSGWKCFRIYRCSNTVEPFITG